MDGTVVLTTGLKCKCILARGIKALKQYYNRDKSHYNRKNGPRKSFKGLHLAPANM